MIGLLLCHREEFTNYFFLRGTDVADQQEWKFFPQVSKCCGRRDRGPFQGTVHMHA